MIVCHECICFDRTVLPYINLNGFSLYGSRSTLLHNRGIFRIGRGVTATTAAAATAAAGSKGQTYRGRCQQPKEFFVHFHIVYNVG